MIEIYMFWVGVGLGKIAEIVIFLKDQQLIYFQIRQIIFQIGFFEVLKLI